MKANEVNTYPEKVLRFEFCIFSLQPKKIQDIEHE